MTALTPHAADSSVDRPGGDRTARAALPDATLAMLFGTLAWLGWLWTLAIIGNAIALWAIGRWGELSNSLWTIAFVGWQHWVIGGAGVTAAVVFLELFVTHGASRRLLGWAAIGNAVILSVAVAAIAGLGFLAEGWWFRRQSWSHRVVDDGALVADVGLWSIMLSVFLTAVATYVTGWLAGALYAQGKSSGLPLLMPFALVPAAAALWLIAGVTGVGGMDVLADRARPSWWVGIPVTLAVTALAAWAATVLTRRVEVR